MYPKLIGKRNEKGITQEKMANLLGISKGNYNLKEKDNGWYIVNDKVECICDGEIKDLKYKPEKLSCGYFAQNILEYLDYLNSSTRKKDIERIPLVKEYIKRNK